MSVRSWLFVPGDSAKKLGKAAGTGADVVILDLEDSVAGENKAAARAMTGEWLAAHREQVTGGKRMGRWVRINALDSRLWRDDLLAVLPGGPDGIMLPKSAGPESLQQLSAAGLIGPQLQVFSGVVERGFVVVARDPDKGLVDHRKTAAGGFNQHDEVGAGGHQVRQHRF